MPDWRKLRAGIERLEGRREILRSDASPWDWYGGSCPCGRPVGECREHPRARVNQRPPDGDWRTWLMLMGRGAGKTRAAAEWVRRRVESGAARRLALVGATAADVRDTMVDGESGLLAISPPWFMPRYEPTKRRITWPNGARATTFSADEPDRLRGPQFETAWCLAGDTRVLMADRSEKPIAAVRAGETVATPIGPRRVLASLLTRRNAEVYRVDFSDGRSIIGTGDHPVRMATGEFVPIHSLAPGMEACAINVSSGEARPGISGNAATTRPTSGCTVRSGWPLTDRSPRATTFTTRTATSRTIGWRISSSSHAASILRDTSLRKSGLTGPMRSPLGDATSRSSRSAVSDVSCAARSITVGPATRLDTAPQRVWRRHVPGRSRASDAGASIAAGCTRLRSGCKGTVRSGVTPPRPRHGLPAGRSARSPVHRAENHSSPCVPMRGSAVANAPSVSTARIASVEKLATRINVYDIAVEEARQFFANGIVVHNCDEVAAWRYPEAMDNLLFGLRLGDDPRLCVTTTPKPVRLVVDLIDDPTTAVARGTTYDNRTHLATSFFDRIVTKYEGTRLGQQELMAEVLEVSDGVWFHRFDPAKHVSEAAEYDPRFPVHLAIDCGVSRHVGAVWFQARGLDPLSRRVTVFGDFHVEGLYSEAAAKAIWSHGRELPCLGRAETVRLDPAANARTGIGPTAYGEYERVFGPRAMARWPGHRVTDGLDQLEVLLDRGLLQIHPRCTTLRAAFQNYARRRTGRGDWLDEPADPQHPHEDLLDALRGGVRDRFPDGRVEQPKMHQVQAGRVF